MGSLEFLVAYVLVPVACFLLAVLMIPWPEFIFGYLLKFVDLLFLTPFPGTEWKLFNLAMVLSGGMAALNFYTLNFVLTSDTDNAVELAVKDKMKATRWRAERNFWMTFFCFALYVTLFRYHALQKKLMETKKKDTKKAE
jgi:hypothetical protein